MNMSSEEIKESQMQGFVGSMEREELVEEEEVVKLESLGFDEMGDLNDITVEGKMVNMGLVN